MSTVMTPLSAMVMAEVFSPTFSPATREQDMTVPEMGATALKSDRAF